MQLNNTRNVELLCRDEVIFYSGLFVLRDSIFLWELNITSITLEYTSE